MHDAHELNRSRFVALDCRNVGRLGGERVFVLRFLQARERAWVGRPFFAAYDPNAAWFDQLQPAFGESAFFFEREGLASAVSEPERPGQVAAGRRLPVLRPASGKREDAAA